MSKTRKIYYTAFIVSDAPIDLSVLSDNKDIKHLVNKEFDMENDFFCHDGIWEIGKAAPEHCGECMVMHWGKGVSISVVIADWFKSLCRSTCYIPLYKKHS
jgi:hypothetical protein